MERAELMRKLEKEFKRLGIKYEKTDVSIATIVVYNGCRRTYITFFRPELSIATYWDSKRISSVDINYENIKEIFFDDKDRRLFVTIGGLSYATVDLQGG